LSALIVEEHSLQISPKSRMVELESYNNC